MKTLGLIALVALAGCGGSGAQITSPFAGQWAGPSAIPAQSIVGSTKWTITEQGAITGTRTHNGLTVPISGQISAFGAVNLSAGGESLFGSLRINKAGNLTGSLLNSASVRNSIDLVRQ